MKFFALPLSLDFIIIARPVRPPTVGPAGHNISDFLSVNEMQPEKKIFGQSPDLHSPDKDFQVLR